MLSARECGCPSNPVGYTSHHTIRSFEKLTAGGAFIDTEVVDLLERVLPARFGGGPTDYQIEQRAYETASPQLRLLVSPALGPVDEAELAEIFLASLGATSPSARIAVQAWREAGILTVERRKPESTASGKVLHVRHARR